MFRRVQESRLDRVLGDLRGAVPDLSTARLGEFSLHTDTEVLLYTTRGGTWPERRVGPEGAPGWAWQDTRTRVLARHGGEAETLSVVPVREDGAAWVDALIG